MRTVEREGNRRSRLLHCVSKYPAAPAERTSARWRRWPQAFGVPVGYSDHTPGLEVPLAAVALGACILEKHFTLDRGLQRPRPRGVLEPEELTELVSQVRSIESSLGDGEDAPRQPRGTPRSPCAEASSRPVAIAAGAVITDAMLTTKRPGTGLHPGPRDQIVGRTARVDIAADSLSAWRCS